MIRVENKQIEDLEDIYNNALIDVRVEGKFVTLTRTDGETFTFTVGGIDAPVSEKGLTGEQGDKGYSAHEAYKRNGGLIEDEVEWIKSLQGSKGPVGDQGPAGSNGTNGKDGKSFKIISSKVDQSSSDIKVSLTGTVDNSVLNLTVPAVKQGDKGRNAQDKTLRLGKVSTVTEDYDINGSVMNLGNETLINFNFLAGQTGDIGETGIGENGTQQDIKFNVNMISEDMIPLITVEKDNGDSNVTVVTLYVPKGRKGLTGRTGPTGDHASIFSETTSIVEISSSEGDINNPKDNSFMPIMVTVNGTKCYGWSTKDNKGKTIQTLFNPKEQDFLYRSSINRTFSDITEGWSVTEKGAW